MSESEGFTIGRCNSLPDGLEEDLVAALGELLENPVRTEPVGALAGPNDLVQVLADPHTWAALAGLGAITGTGYKVAAWLADGLLGPSVKAGGEWIRDEFPDQLKARFARLVELLSKARQKGLPTGIGMRLPNHHRNATIQILSDDPGEIVVAFGLLSYHAAWLYEVFSNPPFRMDGAQPTIEWGDRSPDFSRAVMIDDQRRLYVPLRIVYPAAAVESGCWIPRDFRLYPVVPRI